MRLIDALLPPACVGCRQTGSLLCRSCEASLKRAFDPVDRFVVPDDGVVLGESFACAVAAFAYRGATRQALTALKYAGVRRLADVLARHSATTLDRVTAISGRAALVPVPIHTERRASRGYNQAELIATAVGRRAEMPVANVLARIRPTTKQHRLNRTARLVNLRDAFVARPPVPATVILVDDIITTSATLEACASALVAAGCRDVYGIAVAREI